MEVRIEKASVRGSFQNRGRVVLEVKEALWFLKFGHLRVFVSREERSNNKEETGNRGDRQGSRLRKVPQMRTRMDPVMPDGDLTFMMRKTHYSQRSAWGARGQWGVGFLTPYGKMFGYTPRQREASL